MVDEIDLSTDADLVPILNKMVSVLERRNKETPDERALRLQRDGAAKVKWSYQRLAQRFEAVRDAGTVGEFRTAMASLENLEATSVQKHWTEVQQLRNYLNLTRSSDDSASFSSNIGVVATAALNRTTALEADIAKHDGRLIARYFEARKSGDKSRPLVAKAINELKDSLTTAELKKIRERHEQAANTLANAEQVLAHWSSSSSAAGLEKQHKKKVAAAATRLAEADPDQVLLRKMRKVIDKLPVASEQRRLLAGLADEVAVSVMNRTLDLRRKQLQSGLSELDRAGGSIKRTVNVAAGVELGTVGVFASSKAKLGYSYTIALSRTSDGGYQATVTHKASVGGSAKVGSKQTAEANVSADAAVLRAESFTYSSADELMTELDTTLLKMAVGAGRSDAMSAQSFLKRRQALLSNTVVNRDRLVAEMTRDQITKALPAERRSLPLAARGIEQIERVRTVQWTGQLGLGAGGSVLDFGNSEAGLGKGKFEASGSVLFKVSRSQDFKVIPLLDTLLANPLEQELEAAKGTGLARHTDHGTESHQASMVYYDQLQHRAEAVDLALAAGDESKEVVEEAADLRGRVRSDMERLAVEFDMFAQLRHLHVSGGATDDNAEKLYRQMLKDRGFGAKDKNKAAGYVKALMLQYSMLRNIYDTAGSRDDDDAVFRHQMNNFEERLRVPPIELSNSGRRAAFGDEAASEGSVTVSTTATVKGSYGGGLQKEGQQVDGDITDAAKFNGFGGSLSAAMTYTTKPGQPNSSSLGVVLDFSTSALSGSGSSEKKITENTAEKLAGDLAANVLDRNILRKLMGSDGGQELIVGELTQAIKESLKGAAGRLQISIAPVGGVWRLKSVAAVERSKTGIQIGGSIPVGPTSVAVSAGVHQAKSRVQSEYHSPHTLSGLTDLHRLRLRRGAKDSAQWDAMRKESEHLRNVMDSLAMSTDGATTADGSDLAAVLTKLKNGSLVGSDTTSWEIKNPSVANELVPWLLKLKSAGSDEAKAADDFIEGYLNNAEKLKTSTESDARDKALDKMEQLFNSVVSNVRDTEDDEVAKGFYTKRDLSRDEVNKIVADKLATKFFELDLRVQEALNPNATNDELARNWAPRKPRQVRDLKQLIADARQQDPDNVDLVELEIQAHSMENAVEMMDDLTRWESTAGKDAALARLGKTVDTVFTEPKVYLGENLEGVVIRKNGRVQLDENGRIKVRPFVAADRAGVLTEASIKSSLDRAKETGGAGLDIRPHVAIDLGGTKRRYWRKSDADARERTSFVAKRRKEGKFLTKGRAEKSVKERSRLREAFELLVDTQAREKRLRLLRRRTQERRRDDARAED